MLYKSFPVFFLIALVCKQPNVFLTDVWQLCYYPIIMSAIFSLDTLGSNKPQITSTIETIETIPGYRDHVLKTDTIKVTLIHNGISAGKQTTT